MKTVVGIYDRITQARNAVNDLVDAGLSRDDVSLIAPDPKGRYAGTEGRATAETTETAAAEGAVAGGVIGGLGGVLVGLGAFAIPGIGPIVAAGPIVAGLVGAGVGAAAGGLLGALVGWGVPEEEAGYYAEAVRRGSTLVAVRTPDNQVEHVVDVLERHDPVDVNKRAERWREAGWTGYDTEAEPYTATDIERERTRYGAYGVDEYDTYEPTFRRHYQTTYGTQGQPYNRYEPAYRYGYTLATDTRYRDRDWSQVEPEARRRWETEHEGAWDQFKDAVRNSWEEVKDAFGTGERDYDRDYDVDEEDEATIPVVEEELRVGKRAVERGRVRVHTHVEERPVEENVSLREEHVTVQRRPVDRAASAADIDAFEEGTFEVTETAEEVVTDKRARVIEEVVIRKDVDQRTETVRDTVRRTEVDIDETDEEWDVEDFDAYSTNFRRHYDTNYATTDYTFNQYEPAYRYGYDLATHPAYRDRDWNQIEPEARRQWEERNRGTWEEFKGAVRHGWNELKQAFD